MRQMGMNTLYPKVNTSKANHAHKVYPYLLRGLKIDHANQVWCTDITYIPMRKGFVYLVAIMDWYSRKVLSWQLSNSMEADFCVEAVSEAIDKYGKPEIMNSDQGSQFTGFEWIQALKDADVKISMDGKGRWVDNRMIERLWRSLKYECVYINAFETGSQTRTGIAQWMAYYNAERPHSSHGILTPDEAHERKTEPMRLAA
jgi:putative transposase